MKRSTLIEKLEMGFKDFTGEVLTALDSKTTKAAKFVVDRAESFSYYQVWVSDTHFTINAVFKETKKEIEQIGKLFAGLEYISLVELMEQNGLYDEYRVINQYTAEDEVEEEAAAEEVVEEAIEEAVQVTEISVEGEIGFKSAEAVQEAIEENFEFIDEVEICVAATGPSEELQKFRRKLGDNVSAAYRFKEGRAVFSLWISKGLDSVSKKEQTADLKRLLEALFGEPPTDIEAPEENSTKKVVIKKERRCNRVFARRAAELLEWKEAETENVFYLIKQTAISGIQGGFITEPRQAFKHAKKFMPFGLAVFVKQGNAWIEAEGEEEAVEMLKAVETPPEAQAVSLPVQIHKVGIERVGEVKSLQEAIEAIEAEFENRKHVEVYALATGEPEALKSFKERIGEDVTTEENLKADRLICSMWLSRSATDSIRLAEQEALKKFLTTVFTESGERSEAV